MSRAIQCMQRGSEESGLTETVPTCRPEGSGAKAPSLLDHLKLRFPTFDAKALDLRNPISDTKAQNL